MGTHFRCIENVNTRVTVDPRRLFLPEQRVIARQDGIAKGLQSLFERVGVDAVEPVIVHPHIGLIGFGDQRGADGNVFLRIFVQDAELFFIPTL